MRCCNKFAVTLSCLMLPLFFATFLRAAEPEQSGGTEENVSNATLAYIGTFTGAKSKGIYLFRLPTQNSQNEQNMALVPLGVAAETVNPSFLELDPKRRLLFAVNEVNEFEGKPSGAISAFKIDAKTGKLTFINQRPSMGPGPCQIVLDKTGKNLLVANYAGGSVAVLPVAADGTLGEATDFVQHHGSSVHQPNQKGPHAHCVTLDAANKFAYVCDLGCDKIFTYRFDAQHGKLTPSDPAFTELKSGSGPRHMVFRPDEKFAYVINELNSTVTAFSYDPRTGVLTQVQSVSTLPSNFEGSNSGAEIQVHPSGKWLYVSNRGSNSVVLFSIDPGSGKLSYLQEQSTGGKTPRYFGFDPSAKYLAIANQDSDTILICGIAPNSGRLKPSDVFAKAPQPVCVKFLPPAAVDK